MDAYVKTPAATIECEFALRAFVAAQAALGVSSASLSFLLRSEPGITVTSSMPEVGLVIVSVAGGAMGRVYQLGVQATAPDGDSAVSMTRIRVRDPSLFNLLPGGTTVTPPVGGAFADGLAWSDGGFWSN